MKKLRKNQSRLDLPHNHFSKIDLWISRVSHFSQIGILVVAIFGYFYTVIPLYQKSILDEEIAKKTLELQTLKNEIYTKQRKALISGFILQSEFDCTGLLDRPKEPLNLGEKRLSIIERNPILFNDTASKCFAELFVKSDFKAKLNEMDYEILSKKVALITDNLIKDQLLAQTNFHTLTNEKTINPSNLVPIELNSYTSNAFDILKKSILKKILQC